MDAAKYINTLDSLALTETPPTDPQFAIVDLAADDEFLARLYGAMKETAIDWFSLFIGSKWQPEWSHGPILVNLAASLEFASDLIACMQARPLGVMIHSLATNAAMLQRCQHWLLDSTESALLRFYEPRMLTPLLAALNANQRHHLIAPSERWAWHDGHAWQQFVSAEGDAQPADPPPRVPREQLDQVPDYRLALHAKNYAAYYRDALTEYSDPTAWVMDRLLQAREASFNVAAQEERWLRLAFENGADFYKQDSFRAVMEEQALTPADQLSAMESTSETLNASV